MKRRGRKVNCVVCGLHRQFAYQGDTGPVCQVCDQVIRRVRPPENT